MIEQIMGKLVIFIFKKFVCLRVRMINPKFSQIAAPYSNKFGISLEVINTSIPR